jgi:hypothetical protein
MLNASIIDLMMEAAGTSETSAKFLPDYTYQHPKKTHLNTFYYKNLVPHIFSGVLYASQTFAFAIPDINALLQSQMRCS